MNFLLRGLLVCVCLWGGVHAQTPEMLFYQGDAAAVVSGNYALSPQLRALALFHLGRVSEAADVVVQQKLALTHPLNAVVVAGQMGNSAAVVMEIRRMPTRLQQKYTRLLASAWLDQGMFAQVQALLEHMRDKGPFFDLWFRLWEKSGNRDAQESVLRAWALYSPGDAALTAATAAFSSTTHKKIWALLSWRDTEKEAAVKKAFSLSRYTETLVILDTIETLSPELQLTKGLALFHLRKREVALEVFQAIPQDSLSREDRHVLWYHIAKTYQILQRYDEAVAMYRQVVTQQGKYRAQAYYDLYWSLSASGKVAEFAPFESGFQETARRDNFYEKWVWDVTWMQYLNGVIADAYTRAKSYPWRLSDEFKAKVLFWTAEMASGIDQNAAQFYREKCTKLYPFTYYGARLIARYFPERIPELASRFVSAQKFPIADLGDSVYRAGLADYEAAVLEERLETQQSKGLDSLVVALVNLYNRLSQNNRVIALLGKMGFGVSAGQAAVSRDIAELMYPRYHWDLVVQLGKDYGLDPYLILALMREESLFNARAVSRSGARGLMQIMPTTGQGIAKGLKSTWEGADMLFDPETNIRFGVYYLNYLKNRFEGNVVYMLSGYNAGPNATGRWVQNQKTDSIDLFVAQIPYSETHHYVTRVLKSYWIYTLLYNPGAIPDIFARNR